MERDPGEIYSGFEREYGRSEFQRIDAPATPEQKKALSRLSPDQIRQTEIAGEAIRTILTRAPGNNAPIGGIKVIADNGWFAARPSGTEDIYKIYAESFLGKDHLHNLVTEAQTIVKEAFAGTREGNAE
jgi:phosphoglucomutase